MNYFSIFFSYCCARCFTDSVVSWFAPDDDTCAGTVDDVDATCSGVNDGTSCCCCICCPLRFIIFNRLGISGGFSTTCSCSVPDVGTDDDTSCDWFFTALPCIIFIGLCTVATSPNAVVRGGGSDAGNRSWCWRP